MKPSNIKYIVIHCSATKAQQDIGRNTIADWHKAKGWNDIGYHFVIRRNGTLEMGRPLSDVGAHAYGYNRMSWGVCMVGGLDYLSKPYDNFTDAQFATLKTVIQVLKAIAPDAEVLGHRDLSPDINNDGVIDKWEWLKACPCFDVKTWWGGLCQGQ